MAYSYSTTITIDHTKVSGGSDLSNFPVLISLVDPNLRSVGNGGSVTSSSGYDLVFLDSTGSVQLDHEIERYTASSGAIVMWVRVPTLSASVDTVLLLAYGNAAVTTSQEHAAGVWSNGYRGVWHLKEDPSGTAPQIKDSTANANHGTTAGAMLTANQVAGQVGGALQCIAANSQFVSFGSPPPAFDPGASDFSLEAWVRPTTLQGAYASIINKGASGGRGYGLEINDANQISVAIQGVTGTNQHLAGGALTAGTWYHVVAAFPRADQIYLYRDGVQVAAAAYAAGNVGDLAVATNGYPFQVGARNNGWLFNGQIDEVRIALSARSPGWIATTYANQKSPQTFVTQGPLITLAPRAGRGRVRLSWAAPRRAAVGRMRASVAGVRRALARVNVTVRTARTALGRVRTSITSGYAWRGRARLAGYRRLLSTGRARQGIFHSSAAHGRLNLETARQVSTITVSSARGTITVEGV